MGGNHERQLTKRYKSTKCDPGLDSILQEENSVKDIIGANDKIEKWLVSWIKILYLLKIS